jgi:Flp pilus assembly protein TadD
MKGQIKTGISTIAAAVMLVACASKGPVSSTGTASADTQDKTPSEYKSLVDNASQQVVCRKTAVTGSRIGSRVCMTRADMEAQREHALEVMRDIQSSAAIARPIPDGPPPSAPRSTP